MHLFYRACTLFTKIILLTLTKWQVEGKENTPRKGSLIIIANHLSMIDPPLLSASIPRRIAFMAKEELFRSLVSSSVVRGFGAFPVHRGQLDREALRHAQEVLEKGVALGMFPEGTRSPTAQMIRAYPGTSLIAQRAGTPILPVAIVGTEGVNDIRGIFSRPHIKVSIGEPFHLPPTEGRLTSARLAELTDFIMEHVARLLPEGYQGVYRQEKVDTGQRSAYGD